MRNTQRQFLLWLVIVLVFLSLWQALHVPRDAVQEINFSEFRHQVKAGNVESVDIQEDFYRGVFRQPVALAKTTEVPGKETGAVKEVSRLFVARGIVPGAKDLEFLEENNVVVNLKGRRQSSLWMTLLQIFPMVFLLGLFFFFMRQIQSGGGKALSFGKSKARLISEGQPKVTFENVAGVDEAKSELQEIIDFLKDPRKFTRLGGRIPKGVLLMGPPGTGKTLLARAVAGEAGVPFFSISGSDFVEMFVGVGASRVRDLFEQGKKNAPCIIFIDEIDAVGRHRGAGLGGGHDEREQTLNQLLVEMDGFESNEGVIMIAATNRPDVLDSALLRPGRFDRRIMVPRPDVRGRLGILKTHIRKSPLGKNVDLMTIARGTPGFSGADLESLVNEAALIAARMNKKQLDMSDFEYAKDKVMMGLEHKSLVVSDKEKRNTAYHEAGHALVAKMIPGTDPIHKITIIPRGQALGVTMRLPTEDRLTSSAEQNKAELAILMGGRCAEEIIFNELTTGAANDIERATDLARRMVCEWGMSLKLGPLAFAPKDESYGHREGAGSYIYSEETARMIDQEVRLFVDEACQRAKKILLEQRTNLDRVAKALLEREVIDAEEFDLLVSGGDLKPLDLNGRVDSLAAPSLGSRETADSVKVKALKIEESPA